MGLKRQLHQPGRQHPVPGGWLPGATGPDGAGSGDLSAGDYNANRSESWIAVKPGTEDLVGTSKVFFEKFSTFYDFHLGSYTIPGGTPAGNNIVQGYECVSTGTQAMPPSWMDNTDPNVDFDTKGRAYQVTLPFNPWWTNHLHPDGAIGVSYSDDLGRTWVTGNGGNYLDRVPNQSSKTFGGVEDKQWVAVNHIPGNRFQDHVYAAWAVFNGSATKVRLAISRDRGQSFTKPVTLSASPGRPGRHLRVPVGGCGRGRLCVGGVVPAQRQGLDDLCDALQRRRPQLVTVRARDHGGDPARLLSAQYQLPGRHRGELRGQPDLARASVFDL